MARNPKPTAVLDARGSFIAHPSRGRARADEPCPTNPLGSPPKHLSKNQKKLWKEISNRLAPGVAMESDRDAFEMMVRLTEDMRTLDPLEIPSAQRTTLISLWSRFGMTPADRSKIAVGVAEKSKLDSFLSRRKSAQPVSDPTTVN